MDAELHDAGTLTTDHGDVIKLRLPLMPRPPRYPCPSCGCQVTSNTIADRPGVYAVQCTGCGLVTRVVVVLQFFVVLS